MALRGEMEFNIWHGKFLGEITNINDPENGDRIRTILVHYQELGEIGWALPSVEHPDTILKETVKEGDMVWIEFLYGDMDYPVVSGIVPKHVKSYVKSKYKSYAEE